MLINWENDVQKVNTAGIKKFNKETYFVAKSLKRRAFHHHQTTVTKYDEAINGSRAGH
jgi:hypothetical protein